MAEAVATDKNPKLRQSCSIYLLEVGGWGWGLSIRRGAFMG